jgi:RNA polymerase sigma-70 factor (ECF subfamily)
MASKLVDLSFIGTMAMKNERSQEARRCFDSGRAAWPGIPLALEDFERCFARHAEKGALPLERYAPDAYVAYACAKGVPEALATFERLHAADLAHAAASIEASHAFTQEVVKIARERLLVSKNGAPGKIAEYGGGAPLKTWLCAVALRTALNVQKRGRGRCETLLEDQDLRVVERGPEFEYLRGRYKQAFEDAVRAALERLAPKQRLLLRLNVIDGLSVDKVGALYKVGRPTAARWLANARGVLLAQVHSELHAKMRLTSSELDSVATQMRSQRSQHRQGAGGFGRR